MPGVSGEPAGRLPVLTSVIRRRWSSSVFGIVAVGAVRRRPSDVARILVTVLVLAAAAAGADNVTEVEQGALDLVASLPSGLTGVFQVLYRLAPITAGVLALSALVARRGRLVLTLVIAGAVGWLVAVVLAEVVDLPEVLTEAGTRLHDRSPDFPVVPLAAAVAVLLAARPYVTRPARRMVEASFWLSTVAAVYLAEGLPVSVLASLVLGWGAAALAHLALGSPGGTPATAQVAASLVELGVPTEGLQLDPDQAWGHTSFVTSGDERLAIEVVGRDSTDAQLFAKLWRFVWYKDAAPRLSLRRDQQVEHDALVLLLATRSGARVPELVAVGVAGARDDALLVVRNPAGPRLADLDADQLDDALLGDVWTNLGHLHRARIAHGDITGRHVVVEGDGRSGLVRLDRAEASAPPDHLALDRAQLLVAQAALVGVDRALAVADHALGADGVAELLPYLEPAALSKRSRDDIEDLKTLLADLREAGAERSGVDTPELAALRRFSLGGLVLGAAFGLGVYLLVVQLAGVAEMGDVFSGAIWEWVVLTALVAQLPPFSQAVAMLGAVSTPLPLRPVAVVQYAQAFTGLVGGTAGTATLAIRFFQKQGLQPSVAVSSGVLNSLGGFVAQLLLVVVGLIATGSSFEFTGDEGGVPGWLPAVVVIVVVALVTVLVLPRLRRRLHDLVAAQVAAAWENIRGVISTPSKAAMLLGGNLVSQVLFAVVLGCALHAYGESLPLLQIVVINCFASFVGGMAPVPGGMGVVEGGMIAGFSAAGIPEAEAVAATFTARMFTTYLTPIWGWIALQWLRRHDYV